VIPPRDLPAWTSVGSYRIVRLLGRGGAGAVYEAEDERSGARVALKLLKKEGADPTRRFERERRLLSEFGEGEGFVPLLDQGESPHGPYLVMPLLTGGTLRDRIVRGPLPIRDAVRLVRALAAAAGRAHSRSIVHRDLKPENVLFSAEGRPLIADLGLAKHFDRWVDGASQSIAVTQDGSSLGTLGYAAPEQLRDAGSVGAPTDVFALGVILYECLAGTGPFEAETSIEVWAKIEQARLEPIERVRRDVPAPLAAVVRRALAHDPHDRYPDGGALAKALEGVGSAPARSGTGRRLAVAVGLAVVLGASAITLAVARARARDEAARAASDLAHVQGELSRTQEELARTKGELDRRTREGNHLREQAALLMGTDVPALLAAAMHENAVGAGLERSVALLDRACDLDVVAVSRDGAAAERLRDAAVSDLREEARRATVGEDVSVARVRAARRRLIRARLMLPTDRWLDAASVLRVLAHAREPTVRAAARPWNFSSWDEWGVDERFAGPLESSTSLALGSATNWAALEKRVAGREFVRVFFLEELLLYQPDLAALWNELGYSLIDRARHAEAVLAFRAAADKAHESGPLMFSGRAERYGGRFDRAVAEFEEAFAHGAVDSDGWSRIEESLALGDAGHADKGLALLESTLADKPYLDGDAGYWFIRADVAAHVSPDEAEAYRARGRACANYVRPK
jgi:tetratricopeptide (TPR) repeat protein